jgi:hypothetical protein
MTTTQTNTHNRHYDPYIEIEFTTDYADDIWTSDFQDFSMLIAKTNSTGITCESCTHAEFNLATPFYKIDNSVAFCLSHIPAQLLNEITLAL